MAIGVKAIICPQCGSTNIRMISDLQGVCNACGTKITIQQQIDTQNVINEVHIHTGEELSERERSGNENPCWIKEVTPEYDMNEFIREAWITFARQDAPLEVFNTDFEDTELIRHQIVLASETVNLSWSASIGYDREESYIAMEKGYESVPYYDRYSGKTKYRSEEVQRPVTKTRTVTDWRPANGHFRSKAEAIAANVSDDDFDKYAFRTLYHRISSESIAEVDEDKIGNLKVENSTIKRIAAEILGEHEMNLRRSLPGDRHRDLRYQLDSKEDTTLELWIVPEYRAQLSYDGDLYTKRAFPFAERLILGDGIPNESGLKNALQKMTKSREKEYEEEVWDKTKARSFITVGLLMLSIIASIVLSHIAPDAFVFRAIGFFIATGALVLNTIHLFKTDSQISTRINDELSDDKKDYIENYKEKLVVVLNKKLKSLGYEPVDQLY